MVSLDKNVRELPLPDSIKRHFKKCSCKAIIEFWRVFEDENDTNSELINFLWLSLYNIKSIE